MPAACAASMPNGLSSTTTALGGSIPMRPAASRKRSGAGFPCSTSAALVIRPSNRSHSPVSRSFVSIAAGVPLDATQVGSSIESSAASIPGTGLSSAANASS
jgi:hypothetical protein